MVVPEARGGGQVSEWVVRFVFSRRDLTGEKLVLRLKRSVKWREWLKRRLGNALMKAMNAVGYQRREGVERAASSATRGIGLCMAVAGFGLSRSFALPVDGKDRRKDLIFRQLRKKQAFFTDFSVVRGLISRRLRRKRPFFIFQSLEQ
jgi:hypothetical protein